MKKNLIYMAGALLSSAILTFGCSEDEVQSYREVTVDKNDVFIQADGENPTAEVCITDGNGNYKITVADENIVTAVMDGTHITFTGLKNGTTTATVMDWTKHSTVINVKVKENFELILDVNEENLIMIKNETDPPTQTIGILAGNGGYKVTSSDETVATARLNEEGKIEITGLNVGFSTITVTDADGKQATLEITVCEGDLKIEDITGKIWKIGETSDVRILSGNPEYTIKSNDNTDVATATIAGDIISITGVSAGTAVLTISDKMGLEKSLAIQVTAGLQLGTTEIETFIIDNAPTEITIDGSGDYEITNNCLAISCTVSTDKTKLILSGVMDQNVAMNQTITVVDNVFGGSATITIKMVNYNFDTYGKGRWYIGGELGIPAGTSANSDKPSEGKSQILSGELSGSGTTASPYKVKNGYVVIFDGNLDTGTKTSPQLEHYINGNKSEDITISNLEIVKKEGTKYWIKFREDGRNEDSYFVVWA